MADDDGEAPRHPDDVGDDHGCTCGGRIPRGRRDGFCSSWCKTRDARGLDPQTPPPATPPPATPPTVLAPVESAPPSSSSSEEPSGEDEPRRPAYRLRRRKIADEVEDRLRQADLLNTWQAAQVLDLADALDWNGGSLSARATAHRELERQMSELLRGQDEPGSGVGGMRNELAERRARRTGQAGGAG